MGQLTQHFLCGGIDDILHLAAFAGDELTVYVE
jgi:hypothetical protein